MFECSTNAHTPTFVHLIGHWRVWILTPRWPLASDQKLSCVYNPLSHVAWTLPEVITMVTRLLNSLCSEQLSDHNIKANQSLQSWPLHAHWFIHTATLTNQTKSLVNIKQTNKLIQKIIPKQFDYWEKNLHFWITNTQK